MAKVRKNGKVFTMKTIKDKNARYINGKLIKDDANQKINITRREFHPENIHPTNSISERLINAMHMNTAVEPAE